MYRLYNVQNLEMCGPCETKRECTKRLMSSTNRRRDPQSNWVRCTTIPVEVKSDGETLTEESMRFVSSFHEMLDLYTGNK
jgi:hypothetical protein